MTMRKWLSLFPKQFWFAFAGGCLLRVWVTLITPDFGIAVPGEYTNMAANFLEYGVLGFNGPEPSAFRLPGFPLVIAAVFTLCGSYTNLFPITVLCLAFMTAGVMLTYRLALRLVSERQALVAVWLLVLNPSLIPLNFDIGIETPFLLLLTGLAWMLVRLTEEPDKLKRWALTGIVLGISLTVRSTFMFFPFLLAAAAWFLFPRRPNPKHIVLFFACTYIFVIPWTVRNWVHFGRIVPFEDGMGWHTLYQGSVGVDGIIPDILLPEPMRTYYVTHDPEIGPHSRKLALENIRRSPTRYARYCIGRLRNLWLSAGWAEVLFNSNESFNTYIARGDYYFAGSKVLMKLLEFTLLGIMLWGIFINLGSLPLSLLALMIAYTNIHIFTMGLPRYTTPLIPIMSLFITLGASNLISRIRKQT